MALPLDPWPELEGLVLPWLAALLTSFIKALVCLLLFKVVRMGACQYVLHWCSGLWKSLNNRWHHQAVLKRLRSVPPATNDCLELSPEEMAMQESHMWTICSRRAADPRKKAEVILRKWMAYDIFKPLVQLLNSFELNVRSAGYYQFTWNHFASFAEHYAAELHSIMQQGLPQYVLVLKHLNLQVNTQYLVERIRSLAAGSFLLNFIPTGGFNGGSDLVADSAIIFHCFALYMDGVMLLSEQFEPSSRPFFSTFVRVTNGPINFRMLRFPICLKVSDMVTPTFTLYYKKDIQWYEIVETRNVFATLADFFFLMRNEMNDSLMNVNFYSVTSQIFNDPPTMIQQIPQIQITEY